MGSFRLSFCDVLRVWHAGRKAGGRAEAPPHSGRARGAALVCALAICVYGQTGPLEADAAAARRVAELSRRIEELQKLAPAEEVLIRARGTGAPSSEVEERSASARAQRMAEMDRMASEIHGEIDRVVSSGAGRIDAKSVEARLRAVLSEHANGAPRAFTIGSGNQMRLVVAYALQKGTLMGPDGTSVTLRAYAPKNGKLALVGSSGAGMDGYGRLTVAELRSPVPGELWLLLWGQMTGANGPNIRMRIYACDGKTFRPVWMPENAWGAFEIRVTDWGFTVDGDYYSENRIRHDSYFLATDGVYRRAPDVR